MSEEREGADTKKHDDLAKGRRQRGVGAGQAEDQPAGR